MATLNAYNLKEHPQTHEWEHWWWQTAETGGDGAANDDTISLVEMKLTYVDVCFQAKGTFPSGTTITIVGGITDEVGDAVALTNPAGASVTMTADNDLVFIQNVPPYVGFTITGGSAGDIDVHMSRRYAV